MKFKIVTDSSANFPPQNGKIPNDMVPLTIRVGDKEFVDDEKLNLKKMLDTLATYKGKASTACPSVEDYLRAFGDADRIFCIAITSSLSGSFNAARLAKEDYEAAHPDRKVYVIDSLTAGPELRLLAEKIMSLIENSTLFEEICKKVSEYQARTHTLFCLESLRNLANNGRVSPMVAKLAGVLGIRVVGTASERGTIEMVDKVRGEKNAIAKLFENMISRGYQGGKVFIDNCCNLPAAKMLQDLVKSKFPGAQVFHNSCGGLCSFYAEQGGLIIGFEGN